MSEYQPVRGGRMILCKVCGEIAVEEIHKPHLPFADENGNIHHCYSCEREDWDEAAKLFGTTNCAAKSAGVVQ